MFLGLVTVCVYFVVTCDVYTAPYYIMLDFQSLCCKLYWYLLNARICHRAALNQHHSTTFEQYIECNAIEFKYKLPYTLRALEVIFIRWKKTILECKDRAFLFLCEHFLWNHVSSAIEHILDTISQILKSTHKHKNGKCERVHVHWTSPQRLRCALSSCTYISMAF